MAAAVQRGDFAGAEARGAAAPFPLALPRSRLRRGEAIAEGAQAAVYRGELLEQGGCACAGGSGALQPALAAAAEGGGGGGGGGPSPTWRPVAIKRPAIREPQDLQRFRREVALLARLRHPRVVGLVGARLLPPGEAPRPSAAAAGRPAPPPASHSPPCSLRRRPRRARS